MKVTKIILKGNPLSTQSVYRYVCRGKFGTFYMAKEGKDRKEDYFYQAKHQWGESPLHQDLKIKVNLYFDTHRRVDWDNFHKLSMDALTGVVWVDDSQIVEATVTKNYDKKDPRIEIAISEV
jgi:Holliday junction resolvase RusA-like endonuclease